MLLRDLSIYSPLCLLHRITNASDELEAILLEPIGWIINEVIEKGEINRQPLVNRQRQSHTGIRRISIGIVPRRYECKKLCQRNLVWQDATIVLPECTANQVLIGCRRDLRERWQRLHR